MRALIFPAVASSALLLASCDRGPSVSATNASQQEVAEKVAAATSGGNTPMVEPGRWEGKLTMHELDIPGLPAQAREQMKTQMAQDRPFISCLTDEDVKSKKAFFTGNTDDKSCTYERFEMSGGNVSAVMHCAQPGQGKVSMTMNGRYAPQSYDMTMTSNAEGNGPTGKMSMKMSVAAKRVGACRGTDDES